MNMYTHTHEGKQNCLLLLMTSFKKKNLFFLVKDNSREEQNLDFELSFAVYPASRYRSKLKISCHGLEY